MQCVTLMGLQDFKNSYQTNYRISKKLSKRPFMPSKSKLPYIPPRKKYTWP